MSKFFPFRVRFVSLNYMRFSMILLVLGTMLSVSRASAMSQYTIVGDDVSSPVVAPLVATAYPTLTPIGSLSTMVNPMSTIDISCSPGQPAGWGTVTPSVDWLYACSQCVPTGTAVSLSTSTPGMTRTPVFGGTPSGTGTPSVTGTPSPTPTVSVTPTPSCGDLSISGLVTDFHSEGRASFISSSVVCENVSVGVVWCHGQIVFADLDNYVDMSGQDSYWAFTNPVPLGSVITVSHRNDAAGGVAITNHGYFDSFAVSRPAGVSTCGTYTGDGEYSCVVDLAPSTGVYITGWASGVAGSYNTQNIDVTFSLSSASSCLATPSVIATTTSTPMVCDSYCDCVSDQSVPNLFAFGGSGAVVHQECIVTPSTSLAEIISIFTPITLTWLDQFITYILALAPFDTSIDPWTICVRTRDYSLYLFGVRMPLEAMIALSIFLSGLRFFTPTVFSGASVLGSGKHPVETHVKDKS